jgi:hypothetical protein
MLQKLLLELGYRVVGPAASAAEATQLVERKPWHWPIACALVGACAADAVHAANRLRGRDIPVVWTLPRGLVGRGLIPPHDPAVQTPTDAATLSRNIRRAVEGPETPSIYATPPPQEAWPRVFPQL